MVFAGVIIKGFYEESTKSCATSQGDSIKEHGFGLKQTELKLDRRSYRYWKESKREGAPLTTGSSWTRTGQTPSKRAGVMS